MDPVVIDRRLLRDTLEHRIPAGSTLAALPLWLAVSALEMKARVAYTPLLQALHVGPLPFAGPITQRERDAVYAQLRLNLENSSLSVERYARTHERFLN